MKRSEINGHIKKALAVQKLSVDNKDLLHRLRELSLKDAHTELYNYRYLMERLKSEIKRSKRYVLPLSLIMVDSKEVWVYDDEDVFAVCTGRSAKKILESLKSANLIEIGKKISIEWQD